MRTILSFALLLAGSAVIATAKPNVLFIAIDDQNDWIGHLGGHPNARTPHIDALAARGTAFTNAHCQSPLCNSSRTSLMTGLRPSSTGIYGLAPWFRNLDEFKDLVTLPQHFMANGYRTYYTGKIYHGGYGRKKKDVGVEWDELGPGASGKPFPPKKLVNTPQPHKLVDWGVFPHRDEDKGDWQVATWAVEKLDAMPKGPSAGSGQVKPFFLACGFFLPHVPCYATQKWFDLHPASETQLPLIRRDDRDDTPRFSWYFHWRLPEPRLKFLEETDQWMNLTRSYLACTTFVDSQVKRVTDALARNGFEENTIVVLWSDHGWHIGEKGITGKNTLWDDGTRVPLIFAGPGVKPRQLCGKPAELLDIYPSLIDLCGLPPVEGLEGHSLRPQLRDAKAPRQFPAITTHNHDNHGIRSEKWRYITYADGSEELYDMVKDPNEWTNIAGDPEFADVIARHRKFIPRENRKPAPNSAARILTYENGQANWQGKDIGADEPVPEI